MIASANRHRAADAARRRSASGNGLVHDAGDRRQPGRHDGTEQADFVLEAVANLGQQPDPLPNIARRPAQHTGRGQQVVAADAEDQVGRIPRKLAELAVDSLDPAPIHGQKGRPPCLRQEATHLINDGRAAPDIRGIVERRIAQKDEVAHHFLAVG